MCGDSTVPEDVEKLMNGKIADLIVTYPAYNVNYENKIDYHKLFKNDVRKNNFIMNDYMDSYKFFDFLLAMYMISNQHINAGGPIYAFHSDLERVAFQLAMNATGFKFSETLIWVKNHLTLAATIITGNMNRTSMDGKKEQDITLCMIVHNPLCLMNQSILKN